MLEEFSGIICISFADADEGTAVRLKELQLGCFNVMFKKDNLRFFDVMNVYWQYCVLINML